MDEATDWFMTIPFIFILLLIFMITLMARQEIDSSEESLPTLLDS
jgi:Na+-transporting methylmalonyl-CoA/oxaloacetate decarboxylase gamma subunit